MARSWTGRRPRAEPPGASRWRRPPSWLALLAPASLLAVSVGPYLRSHLSVYDGGLFLTLARFTGPDYLPYRDMWTLYGPGPPVFASAVMDVFGPGLAQVQIATFLVRALLVVGVYLVVRRFVPSWVAATLATLAAAVGYPTHFEQTLVFLVWGLWFALRAADPEKPSSRSLAAAAVLFGLSFWGRYEFAAIGVLLVLGLWLSSRRRLDAGAARRLLWFGLAPPALFAVYLLLVVGWDRAWLNLVEYPFFRYPDEACRGNPQAWGEAWDALVQPFRGRPWTMANLIIWIGTFLAPILGVLCLVVARRRRHEPLEAFVAAAIGGLTLFLWLEHRPTTATSPHPVVLAGLLAAAVALAALARRRPLAARLSSIAVTAVVVVALANSWIPEAMREWRDWPPFDPVLGWEGGRMQGFYDEEVYSEAVAAVQARAAPGEEIFVALTRNHTHHANAAVFYWLADRPPGSRFIEFNPCLTDTAATQRQIVADLATVDVVVATTFFPGLSLTGPAVLDDYLDSHFVPVYRGGLPDDQAVLVLSRRA